MGSGVSGTADAYSDSGSSISCHAGSPACELISGVATGSVPGIGAVRSTAASIARASVERHAAPLSELACHALHPGAHDACEAADRSLGDGQVRQSVDVQIHDPAGLLGIRLRRGTVERTDQGEGREVEFPQAEGPRRERRTAGVRPCRAERRRAPHAGAGPRACQRRPSGGNRERRCSAAWAPGLGPGTARRRRAPCGRSPVGAPACA